MLKTDDPNLYEGGKPKTGAALKKELEIKKKLRDKELEIRGKTPEKPNFLKSTEQQKIDSLEKTLAKERKDHETFKKSILKRLDGLEAKQEK